MPVKIVKRGTSDPPVSASSYMSGNIKVDGCLVCAKLDFGDERGVTKFLVHIRKEGLWYKVLKSSEDMVFLESPLGTQFESKLNSTVPKNYIMVKCPDKAKQKKPSSAVMEIVQRLVLKVSVGPVGGEVVEPSGVDRTKVYGKVKITRRN